jgi:ATP-dependent DNA ligase
MIRRDLAGVRLLTRNGHDWTPRFPQVAEARKPHESQAQTSQK